MTLTIAFDEIFQVKIKLVTQFLSCHSTAIKPTVNRFDLLLMNLMNVLETIEQGLIKSMRLTFNAIRLFVGRLAD